MTNWRYNFHHDFLVSSVKHKLIFLQYGKCFSISIQQKNYVIKKIILFKLTNNIVHELRKEVDSAFRVFSRVHIQSIRGSK